MGSEEYFAILIYHGSRRVMKSAAQTKYIHL
jgi:hypothetical protein